MVCLRLGRAFEEGIACERDLDEALAWYEQAVRVFETDRDKMLWKQTTDYPSDTNEQWLAAAPFHARAGVRRVLQELPADPDLGNAEYPRK